MQVGSPQTRGPLCCFDAATLNLARLCCWQVFNDASAPPSPPPAQVFNDVSSGSMTALECDMEMVSGSMRVAVRGAGPLGKFTATVSNFSVKGRGGT